VNPLPKHVRPRWRYLAVGLESWPDADVDRTAFQRGLWRAARELLGDPGGADAALRVFEFRFEEGSGEAIVRARRGEVDAARAALACLAELDGHPVGVRVRGVSGTVRACEERYLNSAGGETDRRDVAFAGGRRPARSRGELLDVRIGGAFVGATGLDLE